MYFSAIGHRSRNRLCCSLVQKPMTYSTPARLYQLAVEDHDLTRRREVRDITLHVHLRFFTIGRGGERDEAERARADPLRHRADGSALARGVAAFKNDNNSLT